jgi:receptor-type tyrosine-protein phosphatase gamma
LNKSNFRKCFNAAYYYLDDPPNQSQAVLIDWEAPTVIGGEKREAVPVEEFTKHVAQLHADGDIGFSKEYELIQNESIADEHASEHSQHPDNKGKNRYLNIIACKSILYEISLSYLQCTMWLKVFFMNLII